MFDIYIVAFELQHTKKKTILSLNQIMNEPKKVDCFLKKETPLVITRRGKDRRSLGLGSSRRRRLSSGDRLCLVRFARGGHCRAP